MLKIKKRTVVILILFLIAACTIGFISTKYGENITAAVAGQYLKRSAMTTEDGRFEYTVLDNDTIRITKYVGSDTEVLIPSNIDGKSVTSIGSHAFIECSNIISIKIPEGVTDIGTSAFYRCSSLTSIEIPDGVTNINYSTFYGCQALKEIELPKTLTNIGENAFYQCQSLIKIDIPEGVAQIGNYAFGYCSSLSQIYISNSVEKIGDEALWHCYKLAEINVSEENKNYSSNNGVLFNKLKTNIIRYAAGKTESTYRIPDGVTDINEKAFDCCLNLTNIELPEGIINIGNGAFQSCEKLTDITIPSTVINIGENVFQFCHKLKEIEVIEDNQKYCSDNGVLFNKVKTQILKYPLGKTESKYQIPEGVTTIKWGAFESCDNLIDIVIPDTVTTIEDSAFWGCGSLTNFKNSNQLISIAKQAFANCSNLNSITIPNTLVSIGDMAFENCNNLTVIDIPQSVTNIGEFTFRNCNKLTSINVDLNNNYYKSVEGVLFDKEGKVLIQYPASKGQIYKIPENTKKIESYAFYGSNIKYLDIPDGLTTIGNYSPFGSGEFLKKIRIPDSITYIGTSIFNKTENLIIYCNSDSYAQQYAIKNNILYDAWENYKTEMEIINIQFKDINLYNAVINGGIAHVDPQTSVLTELSKNILDRDDSSLTIQMEKEDILYVNELNINSTEIKSLKGIENFINLERIWAHENEITDLSPISNLTKLRAIDFEYNNISDISALKNLENLTSVYLMANMRIKDIEPLRGLINLKMLDLTANLIEDISPITNLTNLTELYLGINSIQNIKDLGNLTNLTTLVLSNNVIEDISEISKLTKLETLYIGEKSLTPRYDIATVTGHIVGNKIKDISALSNLTNLKTLAIERNNIEDITPIKDFNLDILYAKNQEINARALIKENQSIEIELPKVFLEAKDETSIAYTSESFKVQNCTLNEEETKLIVDSESIGKEIYIQINGGKLDGTRLNVWLLLQGDLSITSEQYEITTEYINKISNQTTSENFIKNLSIINATEIKVIGKNNEEVASDEIVGTGMTLVLQSDSETKTLKLVVTGDSTGDGLADFKDIVAINRHRLNKKLLEGEYLMAGEVTGDGEIDFKDIVKINKFRLNKITQLF